MAIEVGGRMVELGMPETDQCFSLLARKEESLQPGAQTAHARYLWSLTNALLQPGHEREDLARPLARRLREASQSLPPEHWIRREAERLRERLGGG